MADLELAGPLLLGAVVLAGYGAYRLVQAASERSVGRLVAVDRSPERGRPLRSERHRLSGRPDELRQARDGRWIPVEWKSRGAPRGGPAPSHRVQVWAYCLLCEETTGRPPPFGLLRYGDGKEFRIPWDASARAELLALRAAIARPYDGRASPSVGKCRGCRWRNGCDARAAGS
jgi:CRISPR-associated exonuclease Cas4